ncbi:hypothetical protein [Streptomyces sp. SYSU K217416]
MQRIALLGLPGAGKSTFVELARKWAVENGAVMHTVTLADPLYRAQSAVYEIAGKPLDGERKQDGVLLNFLGSHMRLINPRVLEQHFRLEMERIDEESPCQQLVICSDARPADVGYLRKSGFSTVLITVDECVALERRKARGDISLGNAGHVTEIGLKHTDVAVRMDNSGSMEEFSLAVASLLDSVMK